VLRTSAAGSRRSGLPVATGVVSGIASWALAALAGRTALLARHEQLYLVLRLAGAAFLIVYGLTTLRAAWRRGPGVSGSAARSAVPVEPHRCLGPAQTGCGRHRGCGVCAARGGSVRASSEAGRRARP
jgi:threonine/homoserine/homoserine lactone efflux protein